MNSRNNPPSSLFIVIIGSFRKYLTEMRSIKMQFEQINIQALSPCDSDAINPNDEFVLFRSDPTSNPKILQDSVFAKIRSSTFVVLANIDGYIGDATMIEVGYAIALGVDIYSVEPVENPHVAPYCKLLSDVFPNIYVSTEISKNQKLLKALSKKN